MNFHGLGSGVDCPSLGYPLHFFGEGGWGGIFGDREKPIRCLYRDLENVVVFLMFVAIES